MAEELERESSGAIVPRIKMGQISSSGLTVFGGRIIEEMNANLRWPYAMQTYKRMLQDATIAPAVSLVETAISEVPWIVRAKKGMEEEQQEKVKFVKSVMEDMTIPWSSFISQAATHHAFGFALSEKVYRKCVQGSGSKYKDGLVRLKKLSPIPQDTVDSWVFGDEGKTLTHVRQQATPVSNKDEAQFIDSNKFFVLPRNKFLLFRNTKIRDNPEGKSPLNDCYIAWRYKTELEKHESIGVATDLRGLKTLYLPAEYLAEDATPEMKSVVEYYKQSLSLLHANEQSALILPNVFDERGNKMFDFQLQSVMGQKSNDVREIINSYKKEIITALHASQLILGQEGGGSYSLAETQSGVSRMVIEARLREIRDQLNHDLIPQLFRLNGWSDIDTPEFDFGEVTEQSLDEISKYVQRVAAVGMFPKTAETVNWVTDRLGVNPQFKSDETTEDISPRLTGYTSGSGEGMEQGSGNGTGSSVSVDDNSTSNLEN